jgi:hypothetical protein
LGEWAAYTITEEGVYGQDTEDYDMEAAAAVGRMQAAQWAAAASHLLDMDDDHLDIASVPAESKINRTILPIRQVVDMYKQGVTLYEPFGGMAAGAEMLLGSGIPIL